MKNINKFIEKIVLATFILFGAQNAAAFIVVDGIAQTGDFRNPLQVDFEAGSNNLSFFTDTSLLGPDVFQVTIEAGETLDAAQLINFTSLQSAGPGFFGILDATTFDVNSLGANSFPLDQSLLLTGLLFGDNDAGTDLFESNNARNNAGFTLPITQLTAGEYLFWFNETGGTDIFSIDFQLTGAPDTNAVPLPAAVYLMLAPLATVLGFRKNK